MNVPALVLVLLEGVLGASAHVPLPVTAVAAVVVCGWLALFAARERARGEARGQEQH